MEFCLPPNARFARLVKLAWNSARNCVEPVRNCVETMRTYNINSMTLALIWGIIYICDMHAGPCDQAVANYVIK